MKCPACSNKLTESKAGNVMVDLCKGGCGGVWFDEFELKKFDEPHEFAAKVILECAKGGNGNVDRNSPRDCPKCDASKDAYLIRRWYDEQRQVELDQCSRCSGYWLDFGELATIRGQYTTEAERNTATSKFLSDAGDATFDHFKSRTEYYQQQKEKYEQADTPAERVQLMLKELFSGDDEI